MFSILPVLSPCRCLQWSRRWQVSSSGRARPWWNELSHASSKRRKTSKRQSPAASRPPKRRRAEADTDPSTAGTAWTTYSSKPWRPFCPPHCSPCPSSPPVFAASLTHLALAVRWSDMQQAAALLASLADVYLSLQRCHVELSVANLVAGDDTNVWLAAVAALRVRLGAVWCGCGAKGAERCSVKAQRRAVFCAGRAPGRYGV